MRHPFKSYEISDRPQLIVKPKNMKLPGKAVSIWLHIRCFGMIIDSLTDDTVQDDEVMALAMDLSRITERLTATEFREYEIDLVEEKIIEYLDKRKEVYTSFPELLGTPKPKHHFLSHYGEAIRKFGPPLTFWTGRHKKITLFAQFYKIIIINNPFPNIQLLTITFLLCLGIGK